MAGTATAEVRRGATLLIAVLLSLVAVHVVNSLSGGALAGFGVRPRQLDGLLPLFSAPWIHADWVHLGNNLVGLAIFGALALSDGVRRFIALSAIIIAGSGLLLWLLGRNALHIGASGWIYGLWAYVIARAWVDRSWRNIAISVIVILLYGGMSAGLLPTAAHVSFEAHVFGAITGGGAAWLLRRQEAPAANPVPGLKFWNQGRR